MAKFVLAYHGGAGMAETEEAMAEVMAAWGAWFEGLGAAVVDGGAPTAESKTVSPDGSVSAGKSADPLGGYSILEATSLDAATEMAKGCPVLTNGGRVDVYTTIEM